MQDKNNLQETAPQQTMETTEQVILTPMEQSFVMNYIRLGSAIKAVRALNLDLTTQQGYRLAHKLMETPGVKAEIGRIMEDIKK